MILSETITTIFVPRQKVIDKLKDRSPAFVPTLISEKILYLL